MIVHYLKAVLFSYSVEDDSVVRKNELSCKYIRRMPNLAIIILCFKILTLDNI